MNQLAVIKIFESLSSGIRLDIYRILIKHAQSGLVAGEIGETLGIPPTNLSFHLKDMLHAGLLYVSQEGRFQRYRANLGCMTALIDFLTEECCQGDSDKCASEIVKPVCNKEG